MSDNAEFLFAIGAFLLLGLAADALGRRTLLPRVTLILLCGIVYLLTVTLKRNA